MPRVSTCLMFVGDQFGRAEEAVDLYVSLFEGARRVAVDHFGEEEPRTLRVTFRLGDATVVAMDAPGPHAFPFTPAMSLVVACETEAQLRRAFDGLAEGGQVLMPLQAYPFSPLFGWVNDRYGVSWQLDLAAAS